MSAEDFEMITMSLKFEFGLWIGLSSWAFVLRVAFSFVNTKIKEFMEQSLPAEKESIQSFLNSLPWRLLVFLVNMLISVKLPTTARGGTIVNAPPKP